MRLKTWLVLCLPGWFGSQAQNLVQSNFEGTFVPRYMASGTNSRLPVIFRARLSGLSALTTYRYYTMAAVSTDFGGTSSGAGNPLLMSDTGFMYTSAPSMSSNYHCFTTDSSGAYTGWFGFVHTANTRFTAGNTIYPSITLGTGTSVSMRYALDSGIRVLAFSTSSGINNGTGIYGSSHADPRDIAGLFDNMSGAGRPLSVVYIESENIAVASSVGYYSSYVNGVQGNWGTIVPNDLDSGVRRFSLYSFKTGACMYSDSDANGIWPTGINTVNPSGGSVTPIALPSSVVALPVTQFPIELHNAINGLKLNWTLPGKGSGSMLLEISDGWSDFKTVSEFPWISEEQGRGELVLPPGLRMGSASGKYYLRLKFISGEEFISDVLELPLPSSTEQPVQILGNPVAGRLQLRLPLNIKPGRIEIFNLQGKKCLEIEVENNAPDMEIDLQPGLYLLKYGNQIALPFIKQ